MNRRTFLKYTLVAGASTTLSPSLFADDKVIDSKENIVNGLKPLKGKPINIPAADLKEHMFLMGHSGTGKSLYVQKLMEDTLKQNENIIITSGKTDRGMSEMLYTLIDAKG